MEITQEELQDIVKKVCKTESIHNYSTIIQNKSQKGDGYFGIIFSATVDEPHRKKQHHYIIKLAERSQSLRKAFPLENLYRNEIKVYTKVYPLLEKLQSELEPYWNIPRCLLTNAEYGKEYLVLEDLKLLGYEMCDRKTFMTTEHVQVAMKAYGRFHGLSFGIKKGHPEIFREISEVLENPFDGFNLKQTSGFEKQIKEGFQQLLNIFDPVHEQVLYEKLQKFAEKSFEIMFGLGKEEDPYNLVVHGDSWCNNIFFKYTDDNKPSEIKLIDFQFARLGNLNTDLSLFFYTACSKDQLDAYQDFLKVYHDSFSTVLRDFGFNPQELYPFELLLQHYRKYCRFGLALGGGILRAMLKDPEEVKEFVEMCEETGGICVADLSIKNLDQYFKRMKDVIVHVDEVCGLGVE